MRIKTISLSWFRGAAGEAVFAADTKSAVVYGPNGSGKSSFVDAVEHVLKGGRVGHLSHEYSGRRQERGIINTHVPSGETCGHSIILPDGSKVVTTINEDGSSSLTGAEHVGMPEWDYKRTVLRQDEVAEFISSRKGDKYSTLVPLLDLQSREVAAENIRQLAKSIEERPSLKEKKQSLYQARSERESQSAKMTNDQIWTLIRGLHKNSPG
jgi:DNA repair exonuclease SbcCD ATPase subunit